MELLKTLFLLLRYPNIFKTVDIWHLDEPIHNPTIQFPKIHLNIILPSTGISDAGLGLPAAKTKSMTALPAINRFVNYIHLSLQALRSHFTSTVRRRIKETDSYNDDEESDYDHYK